jgi:chromosome partitioning protein
VRAVLTIALVNLKPGTGKTTSAVWLAHALHARGRRVLLVDADPAASALRWSDLADGFPFRVAGLPVRDLHRRVPDVAGGMDVVIADVPQIEDHAGIARSAMRWAEELVLPVAPAGVELDRMAPIRKELDDLEAVRPDGARASVLLNRVVSGASSGPMARRVLATQGHDVLSTTVPRREMYAQSFGAPVDAKGSSYDELATELLTRDGSR